MIRLRVQRAPLSRSIFGASDWGNVSWQTPPPTPPNPSVSNCVVRNVTRTSVCAWIMRKHVITSPRRLGIHPAHVFKLIPQMPSAWHFWEEAGTPSSYRCWKPSPRGRTSPQLIFFFIVYIYIYIHLQLIPAFFLKLTRFFRTPPPPSKVSFPCVYWQTRGGPWMINHCRDTIVYQLKQQQLPAPSPPPRLISVSVSLLITSTASRKPIKHNQRHLAVSSLVFTPSPLSAGCVEKLLILAFLARDEVPDLDWVKHRLPCIYIFSIHSGPQEDYSGFLFHTVWFSDLLQGWCD